MIAFFDLLSFHNFVDTKKIYICSVNFNNSTHLQELQGWYILCGEALNQFSVLDSKCLKTQINQTQNLEKLTSEQTTSSTSTNPNHPGQLSKYFKKHNTVLVLRVGLCQIFCLCKTTQLMLTTLR